MAKIIKFESEQTNGGSRLEPEVPVQSLSELAADPLFAEWSKKTKAWQRRVQSAATVSKYIAILAAGGAAVAGSTTLMPVPVAALYVLLVASAAFVGIQWVMLMAANVLELSTCFERRRDMRSSFQRASDKRNHRCYKVRAKGDEDWDVNSDAREALSRDLHDRSIQLRDLVRLSAGIFVVLMAFLIVGASQWRDVSDYLGLTGWTWIAAGFGIFTLVFLNSLGANAAQRKRLSLHEEIPPVGPGEIEMATRQKAKFDQDEVCNLVDNLLRLRDRGGVPAA